MNILVIDDQACSERARLFDTIEHEGAVTRLTSFPAVMSIFNGFDKIYWDNDLGNGVDVIRMLGTLYWTDPDLFTATFKNKQHVVHSANPIANDRIVSMLKSIGAGVVAKPITSWRN